MWETGKDPTLVYLLNEVKREFRRRRPVDGVLSGAKGMLGIGK